MNEAEDFENIFKKTFDPMKKNYLKN